MTTKLQLNYVNSRLQNIKFTGKKLSNIINKTHGPLNDVVFDFRISREPHKGSAYHHQTAV